MTAKIKSSQASNLAAKRAVVMNTDKKNPTPIVIAAVVVIALAAGLGFFLFPDGAPPRITTNSPPDAPIPEKGRFTYPVSLFDDEKARHFQYADTESKTTIGYFILKSTDGVIRAAFDACDVCWRAGKGYYQEGGSMVCRNCGRRFESGMVNEVQGGCNPAPLKRTIQGDQVVILEDDLKKGQTYFNFSKEA
ncbi:Fe-S-containing protein [Desulfosarcina sp.]|uniref:Fe-S-containing protein n=1 Tax=Desulfosarcina sp. TaxID=2027861 RepID=UPI003970515F